jgi:hypothetical protein
MPFKTRLKYYFIGLFMGGMMVSAIFKDRFPSWLPGTVVKENLQKQPLHISPLGACQIKCLNISEKTIKELMAKGDVDFSESQVHNSECPVYAIEGDGFPEGELKAFFKKCDSLTILASVSYIDKNNRCVCE